MEYIRAVELYQVRQSIDDTIDLSAGSTIQSNESAVITRLSGAQFTYKLCYLFLKGSLREERPYGELLKVFAKYITVTEKKDIKGEQRTEKNHK